MRVTTKELLNGKDCWGWWRGPTVWVRPWGLWFGLLSAFTTTTAALGLSIPEQQKVIDGEGIARESRGALRDFLAFASENPVLSVVLLVALMSTFLVFLKWRRTSKGR